ncbi:Integrase catalytic subunit [Mycolicibacterium fortuitum]|uniref:Integrase catalytic subunit n=1 Tax=Mycolicibacterium fortuitum TaxID=1766 RepID=A0A378WEV1_MYCFO|nr:Integrase catalytic subunit [Mycolicibacterium fortuitum]
MVQHCAVTAADFWHRSTALFAERGITAIRRCLTDNGSCYRSRAWAKALEDTGTTHKRTRPYTPRTNGKVERFNGTLHKPPASRVPLATYRLTTEGIVVPTLPERPEHSRSMTSSRSQSHEIAQLAGVRDRPIGPPAVDTARITVASQSESMATVTGG